MRNTERNLRRLIRETLLSEAKVNYPGGDSIHGVYDYWKYTIRSGFQEANGRWPTFGEFVGVIEGAVPGFSFKYGANESPDDVIAAVIRGTPGQAFLDSVYRQLVKFINGDDRKDLQACRGIEVVGARFKKEAEAIQDEKRRQREEDERRRAEEYEANYEPKAPPDAPLGRYAFAPQRQMQVNPPPMEKNTPVEAALLRSIRNHLEGSRPLTRQQAEMVTGFIRDGLYPDVFKEPPDGEYYRGMLLPIEDLEGMGVQVPKLPKKGKFETEGTFDITPLSGRFSSSWSYDFDTADTFSLGRMGQGAHDVYSVIFGATRADNPGKFIDVEELYSTYDEDMDSEQEVIGLGTIRADWVKIVRLA